MAQANQAMEAKVAEKWCDRDGHSVFECFEDFNSWLDSSEGQMLREEYKVNGLSQPSKALFAGDKNAYDVAFTKYRAQRRNWSMGSGLAFCHVSSEHVKTAEN